ncbi:cation:proton antiporter [Rhizobacter sp. LjRoot28]|uniref:cation:proton antiporter n=1 Tax=Rhizobacter sp. LjRoot28 TaxID=3342309 RepID=UPI003ECFCF16
MTVALWAIVAGLLLIVMAISTSLLNRLPISRAILYLLVGVAISPIGFGWLRISFTDNAGLIEGVAEVVVLASLFTSGLKLRAPLTTRRWTRPLRLASVSMVVTVLLITLVGVGLLGLSLGAAVLLGAILAPTDPVLAADVQVANAHDRDELRFALTGEGGLNDGTAFPVVMLGLGLLGLHSLGDAGWRWVAVDVVWAVSAGIACGAAVGHGVGALVLYLRRIHKHALGLDNFIGLGVIALSYGVAVAAHAYGFLAVFAAGVAFRQIERRHSLRHPAATAAATGASKVATAAGVAAVAEEGNPAATLDALATDDTQAAGFMAHAVLTFNEQIEHLGEMVAVVMLGALLWTVDWYDVPWFFAIAMLIVVRPVAVLIGLAGSASTPVQSGFIGWFGIKGIGSLYYLAYACDHGLEEPLATSLVALTLSTVVLSNVLHGVSVTPLMRTYASLIARGRSG